MNPFIKDHFFIGKVKIPGRALLAPMAGITDMPFRLIAKKNGAALVVTEMVSAVALVKNNSRTFDLLSFDVCEHPISVQIFGAEPFIMAEAAKIVEDRGFDIIDINMGCPIKKVIKQGAGAALLKEIEKAKEIIAKVKKAVKIPLTVKIRSGWDKSSRNFLEIGYMAEQEGVDAVILHPRLKTDGFSGKARWEDISELKSRLSIPVIGNGDIKKGDDAKRMIETTNCDAVMIGRGSLGNPWIFKEVNAAIAKERIPNPPSREQKGIILLKHLYLAVKFKGELRGVREMRKHMGWYSKGLAAGSNFRKLAHQVNTFLQAKALIIDFFHLKDEDSLGWAFE